MVFDGSDDQWGIKAFIRSVGLYVLVFAVGGIAAFAYSYVPLHNAKNWKIEYLEQRLEETRTAHEALVADVEADTGPSQEALADLTAKVQDNGEAMDTLKQTLAKTEKDLREHRRSRDQWKARYQEAEKARSGLAEQIEGLEARLAELDPEDAIPAAFGTEAEAEPRGPFEAKTPAPVASPSHADDPTGPTEIDVPVGGRWSSDDGRAQFDLVAIENSQAKIVLDPVWLAPGQKPSVISVAAGSEFEVGATAGQGQRLVLKRINGANSITIQAL